MYDSIMYDSYAGCSEFCLNLMYLLLQLLPSAYQPFLVTCSDAKNGIDHCAQSAEKVSLLCT